MKNVLFRQALSERQLTVREAAKKSGISYITIHQHFSGARSVSAEMAVTYERLLGIPRSELRPDLWPNQDAIRAAMQRLQAESSSLSVSCDARAEEGPPLCAVGIGCPTRKRRATVPGAD